MVPTSSPDAFSLLGGPVHRAGIRLGLVRGGKDTTRFGMAVGGILWTVAVVLAIVEGRFYDLFSLEVLSAHVRLLVAIPLAFFCESWFDARAAAFTAQIARSGTVADRSQPALDAAVASLVRWKDSWRAEGLMLLATVAFTVFGPRVYLTGTPALIDGSQTEFPLVGQWYWMICLPALRFVVLRWLWRLALWTVFLFRVSRLELDLVPTHGDGAGGLGYLEVVHSQLTPLVFAISAVQAATFAEEIHSQRMAFASVYAAILVVLLVQAAVFLGPLLVFTPRLWHCRVEGLDQYMELASRYVRAFDRKWVSGATSSDEPLLGTGDIQSLADLATSVDLVSRMRLAPISMRGARGILLAAFIPMLPLFLLEYPITRLTEQFFSRLAGL